MIAKSIKLFNGMIFMLFFVQSSLIAQDNNMRSQSTVPRDSLLKLSRTIIDSAKCRVLITTDENGIPHAREMSPFPPEEDMVIWLGTNPLTRKAKQIEKNPNVVMYYYDSKTLSYVSIQGKAQLVNDSALKTKYWKDYWNRYYPDRDKDYILIKIIPVRLEIMSFGHNILWLTESYLPHSVEFDYVDVK